MGDSMPSPSVLRRRAAASRAAFVPGRVGGDEDEVEHLYVAEIKDHWFTPEAYEEGGDTGDIDATTTEPKAIVELVDALAARARSDKWSLLDRDSSRVTAQSKYVKVKKKDRYRWTTISIRRADGGSIPHEDERLFLLQLGVK